MNFNFKLAMFLSTIVGMIIFYNLSFLTDIFKILSLEMIFFILIINSYLVNIVAKNKGFTKENLFLIWN